jgi:hypothetical protein
VRRWASSSAGATWRPFITLIVKLNMTG